MEGLFEVVILPVADADRALRFYRDQLGFKLDVDYVPAPGRAYEPPPVVGLDGGGSGAIWSTISHLQDAGLQMLGARRKVALT